MITNAKLETLSLNQYHASEQILLLLKHSTLSSQPQADNHTNQRNNTLKRHFALNKFSYHINMRSERSQT